MRDSTGNFQKQLDVFLRITRVRTAYKKLRPGTLHINFYGDLSGHTDLVNYYVIH